jgi:hypothetical protein
MKSALLFLQIRRISKREESMSQFGGVLTRIACIQASSENDQYRAEITATIF